MDNNPVIWANKDVALYRIGVTPFDGGDVKFALVLTARGHPFAVELAEASLQGKVFKVDLVTTPLIVGDIADVDRMLEAG